MIDVENSINPKVQKFNGRGHFCETMVLLMLTLMVCGFFVLDNRGHLLWWTGLCAVTGLVCWFVAWTYSMKAIETYQSTRFEVTHQTVETLQATNAAPDAIDHLRHLQGTPFVGEGTFFQELDKVLGAERCAELKGPIFKYAKTS